ncbi:hypothetical protein VT84_31540 [Gemmata sp. SH-PL17]|uniref:hypothetical protein n=1 Tax=Gemmata sp. SH-PL17 TaxID=1630693 RepID=UPI00078D96D4|nr:hypothetical protein [Gemmata sp. SH-PL17]AMV28970.1 hypothetical protein VT84_31540 [Gemmata sp. SH-PL17]
MPTAATIGRILAVAFTFLLIPAPVSAKDSVKITGASVGLPTGRDDAHVTKFGAWAPVHVQLEPLREVTEPAELVIESPDADEVTTTFAVPLNLATDRTAIGYVRPGGAASEVTITVRAVKGGALSEPFRVRVRPHEPLQYVVLALGGAPAGFELPKPAGASAETAPLRAGRVELTHIGSVAQLPDRWYGYEGADLAVLNTGTAPDFLKQLFGDDATAQNKQKREALIEWVRRGGRLVISAGSNAALVAQLPALKPLLPFTVKPDAPARQVDITGLVWSAGSGQANTASAALTGRGTRFAMANLVPQSDRPARVLIPPSQSTEERQPIVAQAAFGLGRVTVIGFDLDSAPFAEFSARPDFWDFVLRECGANRASSGGDGKPRPPGVVTEEEDSATVAMRVHNDTFDGVPVVSFGWVALLIVLYILLIGPVEYYVLKRFLGRLELTWITFPIIVLTVSVLTYVSASAVKGRDLKINKIDVVDVDAPSNRIYGTTWFTIFSPRIDSYTVGVTPGSDWGTDEQPKGTAVECIGAPRSGRAGITRRKYAVEPTGLENVPIQIWSTKAFSANWSSPLDIPASQAPTGQTHRRLEANLVHPPGDRAKVLGSFEHNLPLPELTECVAFYAGHAYPLPGEVIVRGAPVRLVLDQGTPATQWLQKNAGLDALLARDPAYAQRPVQKNVQRQSLQQTALGGPLPLMGMLFHEGALKNDEGVIAGNASLRRLDQSWRLAPDNRDEVIVVGRVAPPLGSAEDVLTGPNAPAKLWLKGLPGSGERRPIPGTARQETWVRFYIPVK